MSIKSYPGFLQISPKKKISLKYALASHLLFSLFSPKTMIQMPPRMFISSPYLMQKSALVQLLIIIKHLKYICHLKHRLKTKLFIFLQNIPFAFLTYVCSLHHPTHKPGL